MIYFLFVLSLAANGILVWYVRSLIKNYINDREAVERFTEMIEQYSVALTSLYKMEELYGDENIKKAIIQTKFVIEACREFNSSLVESSRRAAQEIEETEETEIPSRPNSGVIKLREGEKITQNAGEYRQVISER